MSSYPRRQVLGTAAAVAAAAAVPLAAAGPAAASDAAATARTASADAVWGPVPDPVPVPLDAHFDNDGVDTSAARGGDFDGSGYTFPGEELPAGPVELDGIAYVFPSSAAGAKNNIVAMGQRVDLPKGRYLSAMFLTAGSYGNASGSATVHYADGSTASAGLGGADWYSSGGPLSAAYRYKPDGTKDTSRVGIGTSEIPSTRSARPSRSPCRSSTRPRPTRPPCTSSGSRSSRPRRAGRLRCATRTPRPRSWSRPARRASRRPS